MKQLRVVDLNAWEVLRLRSRSDPSLAPRPAGDRRATAISPDGREHRWDGVRWKPVLQGRDENS